MLKGGWEDEMVRGLEGGIYGGRYVGDVEKLTDFAENTHLWIKYLHICAESSIFAVDFAK